MPSSHLILCHPLLLLPTSPPSIRVFSNESTLHMRWPKYWSFSFSISPSNEHPGLISFRMDWMDFLAVQGSLKSLLQHHSSKASIFRRSAFFTVQLSHPYMTTGKSIALTRWNFRGTQSISPFLLFNHCVWLFVTPWTAACQASLSFTISQSLFKFMSIESVMLSNHLILCHPLLRTAQFSSVQFSHSVVSYSLWPHGLQHTRLPCPSPTPELDQTHIHPTSSLI